MNTVYKIIFLCFSILMFITSCKEEKDKTPPSVSISSPVNGEVLNADSGFFVVASVADNEIVTDITIKLFDLNTKEYYGGIKTFPVNKTSDEAFLFYEITDEDFPSSNYSLEVFVSDGDNTTIKAVEVQINYSGYRFQGTLFSSSSGSTTNLNLLDKNGSTQSYGQKSMASAGVAINKKNDTYILLGRNSPVISGYNFVDNSLKWTVQLTPSGGTYQFSKLREIDEILYCLSYNNQIYKFDLNGVARGVITTDNQPQEIRKIGRYLYTIEKRISDQRYYLVQYALTGVLLSNREINMEAIGIEDAKSSNVYILGNTASGNGRLMEFKSGSSALNVIRDFSYPFLASFSYGGNVYYNSASTGNLYEYSVNMTDGIIKNRNVFADEFYIDAKNRVGLFNHFQNGNLYELDLDNMSSSQVGSYANRVNSFSAYYKK